MFELKWSGWCIGLALNHLRHGSQGVWSVLLGPIELLWARRFDLPEAEGPKRLWWLWSMSRVWLVDTIRTNTWAWGFALSFDPDVPESWHFRVHFGHVTSALRWVPAQILGISRRTMREDRKAKRVEQAAEELTKKFAELFRNDGEDASLAELLQMLKQDQQGMPDFRGNPNLN